MTPSDELLHLLVRHNRTIKRLSYGEAKLEQLRAKERLRKTERDWRRVFEKFKLRAIEHDKEKTTYPEFSADSAQLIGLGTDIVYLEKLIALFQWRMEACEEDEAMRARVMAKAPRQTLGPSPTPGNVSIDIDQVAPKTTPAEPDGARTPPAARDQKQRDIPASEKKKPKPKPSRRYKKIYSIIKKKLNQRRYAIALDNAGIKPPEQWIDNGYPPTYLEIYDADEEGKNRIRKERSRVKKRVEEYSPPSAKLTKS